MKKILLAMTMVFLTSSAAYALPMVVSDFGNLNGDAGPVGGFLSQGEIQWYSFTIGASSYLDITTNGSQPLFGSDTELGLYDGAGNFLATNDDDGGFLDSLLSFGTGSGNDYGSGDFGLGQDGAALLAGTYFIAVGMYDSEFGLTYLDVTGGGSGEYELSLFSDAVTGGPMPTPEPGILLLLGLGLAGLGFAGRRN